MAKPLFYLLRFASAAAVIAIGEGVGKAYAETRFTDSDIRANKKTKTTAVEYSLVNTIYGKLF